MRSITPAMCQLVSILIDGKRFTDLMIRFGVGVQVRETHKVVEIDEGFFE